MSYRIGVDVGGTFTDLVLLQEETGEVSETKVLTTDPNPAEGVLQALKAALARASAPGEEIQSILHGTTIATNSLIERKGAKTALLTSQGFRDILEIGRQIRPKLFDWSAEKPQPLVPRKWRFELNERVRSDGSILASPRAEEVAEVLRRIKAEGIEAVAVSFLFSFLTPKNEEGVGAILRAASPGLSISLSSRVLPEYREYERTSTTCANAFITPVLNRYTEKMESDLLSLGLAAKLKFLQSNGGIATAEALRENWITTAQSGPAGGVTAATYLAKVHGIGHAISMDIGGTSCDTCLIRDGLPGWTTESQVGGMPIRTPMIDVQSIGAGGGSVIHIDGGGALRVGPRSCGSDPGPACYDRGGREAAITDAHLLIGTLQPKYFLKKGIQINVEKANAALAGLGASIGLSAAEAAAGAIEVMNHNIAQAIRIQVVAKGLDLGLFALIAFGGAGPLHACFVADLLGMKKILFPDFAGVFSALGAALADYRHDFVQAHPSRMDRLTEAELEKIFSALERKGEGHRRHHPRLPPRIDRSLDLRYVGQSFEINVPLDAVPEGRMILGDVIERFHRLHEEAYGYCDRRERVELVNLRLSCFAITSKPPLVRKREDPGWQNPGTLSILSPGTRRMEEYALRERIFLGPGEKVTGPAIVLSENSTAILPQGWEGSAVEDGTLILCKGGAA